MCQKPRTRSRRTQDRSVTPHTVGNKSAAIPRDRAPTQSYHRGLQSQHVSPNADNETTTPTKRRQLPRNGQSIESTEAGNTRRTRGREAARALEASVPPAQYRHSADPVKAGDAEKGREGWDQTAEYNPRYNAGARNAGRPTTPQQPRSRERAECTQKAAHITLSPALGPARNATA